jgi:uncharacterized membrane protein
MARTRTERLAAALRTAALGVLALGLGGFALTATLPADRATVIVAVDQSESIDAEGRAWSHRFINQLAAALPPGDELGVVTFAGDVRVLRAPSKPRPLDDLNLPLVRTASDLGQGLDTALALLPPETAHRVLLISDGNETRGDVRTRLARAQRAKAAVFTAVPPRAGTVEVAVDKLAGPLGVVENTVFPLRVVVHNSHSARPAELTLALDGEVVGREWVTLEPGLNTLEIPYRLTGTGGHRLRVRVEAADDGLPGNNYRDLAITVAGQPKVLLLTPNPHSPVVAVLEHKDIAVERRSPGDIDDTAEALLAYHAVVAENTLARDFPSGALAAIERYVREFGGAFVFIGGQPSFGDADFRTSPLAPLLPVTLEPQREPPRERDPLALMVLIDRSNSMGYSTEAKAGGLGYRNPATSKLHYAKTAALTVIRQLKDHDYVGVIAFDSQALPVALLQPLRENRAHLESLIPQLVENGGTDFYDALDSARRQLADSPVARRHVILLTDGDTNRSAPDHYPLIAALSHAAVSVTTIRIGDDIVNVALLNDISSQTGGNFYHVEDIEALPQLLLRDAAAALAQTVPDQGIQPRVGKDTQVLRGMPEELPVLRGYAFAKPKSRADVPLYAPGRADAEPILATWQYGLGRVAAFTADPVVDAEAWIAWEGYGKFWSQVVRWVMRPQTASEYALAVERREGKTTLRARAFDPRPEGVVAARLHLDEERAIDVTLAPAAPQVFEGELPSLPGGRYPITMLRRAAADAVVQRTVLVSVPEEDDAPQEEFRATQPHTALLEWLATATGGKFNPTARDLAVREPGTRRVRYPLDFALIPLAMLLFLADVAVRRLWLLRGDQG